VLGISLLCRRLGRSLGEKVGNEVLGFSLGNIEYLLGSDDGIWLGDLLARGLRDTLGRAFVNEVIGLSGDMPFSGTPAGPGGEKLMIVAGTTVGVLSGPSDKLGDALVLGIWLGQVVLGDSLAALSDSPKRCDIW
jgi:hypothetical protein